jgi:hypothetical protein
MAERDVFEGRLRAALLRHVADAPAGFDALDFARAVAAKEPRRHGLATTLGWRMAGVPRLAWVFLLLAALLAATIGGALFVGSHHRQPLPAVLPPVGRTFAPLPAPTATTAFACPPGSKPDTPGPADQARPPGAGPMAFDRAAGKIVMLAGAGTWTFDVCTNTWTLAQSGAVPDPAGALAYDPVADLIINVDYPEDPVAGPPHAWAYSLTDNTWTRKGLAPFRVQRMWFDPASARVAAWATRTGDVRGTVWTYDVASDTWTTVGTLEVLGGFPWGNPGDDLLAYDASFERVVATVVVGSETRLFDMRTGSVADARAAAPWGGKCGWFSARYCYDRVAGAAIAYDERAQRTVVLIGGYMFGYDAAADRWDTLYGPGAPDTSDAVASANAAAGALARQSESIVSDPVNGRLVVPGGVGGAVLAFDATTREWTVLLEPSKGQPTPSP